MRLCALVSGGKDSVYALHRAVWGGHSVECILVFHSMLEDSWLFHTPATRLVSLQAEAMGLRDRLVEAVVSGSPRSEIVELEDALRRASREFGVEGVAVGVIASRFQRDRVSSIASRLGLEVYAPLWGASQEEHMWRLLREGFRFVITKVSTMGLTSRHVGVVVDERLLAEILELSRRYGFNPAFEGGEAETLVVEAPLFREKVCLEGRVARESLHVYKLEVSRAWLEPRDGRDCVFVENSES